MSKNFKITNVLHSNIDDVLEKDVENDADFDSFTISNDMLGDDVIMTFGKFYRVVDKGLIFCGRNLFHSK